MTDRKAQKTHFSTSQSLNIVYVSLSENPTSAPINFPWVIRLQSFTSYFDYLNKLDKSFGTNHFPQRRIGLSALMQLETPHPKWLTS